MDDKIREALKSIIQPLRTVVDDGAFQDLESFGNMLDGVKIVGLGEGSHGTREHFQLKHRLIRYLVEKKGFRTFAIEAATDACLDINDYVLYGKGDKHKALAGQSYWVWDTEEVLAMIDWMREHNLNCERGQECSFVGFDMKPVKDACRKLMEYLSPLGLADYPKIEGILKNYANVAWPIPAGTQSDDIIWLMGYLYLREIELVEKTCRAAYDNALFAGRIIYQYVECRDDDTNGKRDLHMAENISLLVNSLPPDEKIILWAHNGHIACGYEWKNIGQWLRDRYGSRYFALGFMIGGGKFQSRFIDRQARKAGPLMEFDVPVIDGNLWEADVATVYGGDFYFNLRDSINNNEYIRKWAAQNKPFVMLDEGYNPNDKREDFEVDCSLSESYDAIVYTEKTTRSRPTPTGMRD